MREYLIELADIAKQNADLPLIFLYLVLALLVDPVSYEFGQQNREYILNFVGFNVGARLLQVLVPFHDENVVLYHHYDQAGAK